MATDPLIVVIRTRRHNDLEPVEIWCGHRHGTQAAAGRCAVQMARANGSNDWRIMGTWPNNGAEVRS